MSSAHPLNLEVAGQSSRDFQVVSGVNGLDEIRAGWTTLTGRSNRFRYFHLYAWYRSYVEALEPSQDRMQFVLSYRSGTIEAILPLRRIVKRILGLPLRILQIPQHPHLNFQDIVLDPSSDCRHLLSELLGYLRSRDDFQFDALQFGEVLEDSAIVRLLRDEENTLRPTMLLTTRSDALPVMHGEELRAHVSKNLKGNLRKAMHKLETLSRVEFLSSRNPEDLDHYLDWFLDVEASGWKGAQGSGSAIKLDEDLSGFYRRVASTFGETRDCEINLLKVDGECIAGQFAVIAGETLYILKIGYDEEFRHLAPGNLLLANTIERLHAESEIRNVSLVTDASWHWSWRPQQLQAFRCCLHGRTVMGWLYSLYGFLRYQARMLFVR